MARILVLIADDHAVVREGLALVLGSEPDMHVVGSARDGEEAVRLAAALAPHVALLDLRMPKLGGVAAVRALRERCPETKVVVLSMYDDERLQSAALAAGAHGYLSKSASSQELLSAIRAVHKGARIAGAERAPRMSETSASMDLSVREHEVAELVAAGHTSRAIADRLGISKSSVDTYRARVLQKLGVSDRAELMERLAALGKPEHGE